MFSLLRATAVHLRETKRTRPVHLAGTNAKRAVQGTNRSPVREGKNLFGSCLRVGRCWVFFGNGALDVVPLSRLCLHSLVCVPDWLFCIQMRCGYLLLWEASLTEGWRAAHIYSCFASHQSRAAWSQRCSHQISPFT